jgi:predicted DNA-binding protein
MKIEKKQLSIRFPLDLLKELKQEAQERGRSIGNYIVWILKNRRRIRNL